MRGYAEAMPNQEDFFHEETIDPLVAAPAISTRWKSGRATERRLIASFMLATVLAGPVQCSSVRSSTGCGST